MDLALGSRIQTGSVMVCPAGAIESALAPLHWSSVCQIDPTGRWVGLTGKGVRVAQLFGEADRTIISLD
jgi:hypothetical protein